MEATIRYFDKLLSIAGVTIYSEDAKFYSKIWLFIQILNFIAGGSALVFTTGFVVVNLGDLTVLLKGASIWSTCIIMSITFGICLYYRRKFREYVHEMAYIDSMLKMPLIKLILNSEKRGKTIDELKKLVHNTQNELFKLVRLFMFLYVFFVFLTATLYLVDPVYRIIKNTDSNERIFAYDMWFPWSNENFYVYLSTFIYHVYAGYLCCIAYPGLQGTILLLLGQVIRQIKILRFIMMNMSELMQDLVGNDKIKWQEHCTAVLSQCVQHYIYLKSFSGRLNMICRPFYLALIMDATVLVCMCSVQIAISKFTMELLKYYIHEISFILMVFTFCFLGQKLENETEALENSSDEKWYIYDLKYKKHLLIFKTALRQGMSVKIFGSIPLSLSTFAWFLKTEMSFFTLIMSLFEEN